MASASGKEYIVYVKSRGVGYTRKGEVTALEIDPVDF